MENSAKHSSNIVISIPNEDATASSPSRSPTKSSDLLGNLKKMVPNGYCGDSRKLIHSLKLGLALVFVSLLYFINPLYERVGENAMWAVMTVVVVFEFSAGATVSKGLNRGMGTILGGGLGCLTTIIAEEIGGVGKDVTVGLTVFIFGALASYTRLVPSFKKKFDYGALIFILTFNLITVSGIHDEKVVHLAIDRLLTIGIGFTICIFTSLVIFPIWASDELHSSTASKFGRIASSIEGCIEEYFKSMDEKDNHTNSNVCDGHLSVLQSKSKDEILANFARWEPWHGKFGWFYPWNKYLHIGDLLCNLAASTISMRTCLQSPRQPSSFAAKQSIKEPCESVALFLASTLRELGDSIKKMRIILPQEKGEIAAKLKKIGGEISSIVAAIPVSELEKVHEGLAMASFVFSLMEVLEKVETLVEEVEQLGNVAGFGKGGGGITINICCKRWGKGLRLRWFGC